MDQRYIGAMDLTHTVALTDPLRDGPAEIPDSLWDILPAAIYVCDRDGKIVRYNRRAAELWGRTPKIGDSSERFCGSHRLYRLDGGPLPHAAFPIVEVLRTGEPVCNQEVVVERPDGSRITVLVNITALKDATGTVTGAINCFHDISERKQVENQLRVSENELADFFDNVSVPLHLVAQDGTIVRANDAELELLGFAREDYVGRNIVEFHVDHSTIDDILTRLRRGEKLSKYPSKLRAKDGSIKDVEISSSARFVNGEFVNTRCCTADVTRRQELERAWRGSQADLSAELEATQLLQAVATELIHDQEPTDRLYHKLAEAAAAILRSDFASMQMLYPERGTGGELRLLASRGFDPEAVKFWEWVRADSGCTCGEALRTRKRAIASDVETCPFMAGTPDREAYLQAGMGAAQSTPLISRDGRLIGMLSTHWRQPHYPSESELRRFDILARQAADVVERARTTEALRESEARLRAQVEGPVHRPR